MKIEKPAQAGTLESNDIYVQILPNPKEEIEIRLKSVVMLQFGKQIRQVAMQTLNEKGITSCILNLEDKGALDYTIKARIESAVERSLC
ncbi:MAG: citrate lyase acyl carrier protein [Firmicutes bacterium GWF2_51_9]|nr:citrate lyase acyl carrier protein [Erysipelotrichaceae bacterium]OGS54111.1 MAG: citrate lyase acyl carrier protein [Firmicutes bacterium GWF2_51_9]OGS58157.1 MAG: citrate lyase acyl carrier protein [Firmicutes bacterium GWE2_51_13]HAM63189.1 citrate lyase acyl carrier protein [Erysipelotrichaceae bacterium]HAO61176.1 citrate lyase acyl carrier protein [Erysipelotrichaceae bacterium]